MNKFKMGLDLFFPKDLTDYILSIQGEIKEAEKFAYVAQKNGADIDPEAMTKFELVKWFRRCQEFDL